MTTAHSAARVAAWLAANPPPLRASLVPAWSARVQCELGQEVLGDLVDLLAHGDLEQQYQGMAAARALGAEVWAEGVEPEMTWLVTLPGQDHPTAIQPIQQLPA